jgi:hypothetical protein
MVMDKNLKNWKKLRRLFVRMIEELCGLPNLDRNLIGVMELRFLKKYAKFKILFKIKRKNIRIERILSKNISILRSSIEGNLILGVLF